MKTKITDEQIKSYIDFDQKESDLLESFREYKKSKYRELYKDYTQEEYDELMRLRKQLDYFPQDNIFAGFIAMICWTPLIAITFLVMMGGKVTPNVPFAIGLFVVGTASLIYIVKTTIENKRLQKRYRGLKNG